MPARSGRRNDLDAVLAGGEVLDQEGAVGPGLEGAVAHRDDRTGCRIIARAERVAVGILGHLAAGDAVAAARLGQQDAEAPQAEFLRQIRRVVDRLVVVEGEHRDLRGGDGLVVHRDRDRGLAARHRGTAHLVAAVGQHRDEVALGRIEFDRRIGRGAVGLNRHVAGVEAHRQIPSRLRRGEVDVLGGVLLDQPAKHGGGGGRVGVGDRRAVLVDHVDGEHLGLDQALQKHPGQQRRCERESVPHDARSDDCADFHDHPLDIRTVRQTIRAAYGRPSRHPVSKGKKARGPATCSG